ncbi:MAG: hypothetical protein ACJ76H_13960 [Bacteriovoracaceae bacterium]
MITILLLLTSFTVFSQTLHLAVLGGSGEPQNKDTTIFDSGLEKMGEFNRSHPGIKSQVMFNGGHAKTEEIARVGFGSSTPFSAKGYYQIIQDYKTKLANGEIKSGDKILLDIYSHGATRDLAEKSHKIAAGAGTMTNADSVSGVTTVSLDELKSLSDLAKSKGVKLAIVDLSCHSGNSLALAGDNTCVISATGPNHYSGAGTMSFGTIFSGSLASGKSLEEVYLNARAQFNDPSFPMISSPAGKEVQEKLYDKETPFLYYYSPLNDKFTPYMESLATGVGECSIDSNLFGLNSEIDKLLKAGANAELTNKLENFRSALTEYHDYIRDLKQKMDAFGVGEISKPYQLCSGDLCVTYTAKEIASKDFAALRPYYEDQHNKKMLDILGQATSLKGQLLAQNSSVKDAARFWQSLPDLQRKSSMLQSNVAKSQRELYLEMYRRSQATGPNPCRDFKL